MLSARARCRGFTLAELMIAGALGLFVAAGIAWLTFGSAQASRDTLLDARLRQALVTAMAVMTGELRRAGYSAGAGVSAASGHAPPRHIGPDCILYSYDQDHDDADGMPDDDDRHGLRLAGGALQWKTSDPGCGAAPCASCAGGHWFALTDPQTVTVTALRFDEVLHEADYGEHGDAAVVRAIRILLAGELRDAPAFRHRLHAIVEVRNDEIR